MTEPKFTLPKSLTKGEVSSLRDPSSMSPKPNLPIGEPQYKDYMRSIPDNCRISQHAALSGESKAGAVKAKCQECVGFEDVVVRVGQCTTWRCPLWQFRPYQPKLDTCQLSES